MKEVFGRGLSDKPLNVESSRHSTSENRAALTFNVQLSTFNFQIQGIRIAKQAGVVFNARVNLCPHAGRFRHAWLPAAVGVAVAFHVFLPRVRAGENGASADSTFFEMRIRPLLAEHCYSCHGEEKQKGHLRLDSRAAMLKGGESGPAIVPGQPGQSRLMEAVRYQNPDLQMPP